MKRHFTLHIALLALIGLLVTLIGCRRPPLSPRLNDINTLSETAPLAALDSLCAINPDTLSGRDRNYYDFLTVKCERKAYLPIESDSLILKVIDYASQHEKDGYYPEALYTGGLVYAALGDQPTALDYYQNTLVVLPDKSASSKLKSKVLSQIGRLLAGSQLYGESIPYITEAIANFIDQKDTLNTVLGYQLLASVHQNINQPESADTILRKALAIGGNLDRSLNAITRLHLGISRGQCQEYNHARAFIRNSVDSVSPYYLNSALAHAAQIYKEAGVYDTAYMYADRLIHSSSQSSKASGYEIVLSTELTPFIPKDSISQYYAQYAHLLAQYYNENSNALFLQQMAMYNYRIHKQKHLEAEAKATTFSRWIAGLAVVIALMSCFGIWAYTRHRITVDRLERALSFAQSFKSVEIKKKNTHLPSKVRDFQEEEGPIRPNRAIVKDSKRILKSTTNLRKRLQKELQELAQINPRPAISAEILESDILSLLNGYLSARNTIHREEEWKELENVVLAASPEFKSKLQILAKGNLEDWHYKTALLIKAGYKPHQITSLLGMSNSSINYRQNKLSEILFDVHLDRNATFAIIKLL